ncbi:MAG: hybrid sensor histidine kinase/response regulator [candidate division WOR-3 bacterium]
MFKQPFNREGYFFIKRINKNYYYILDEPNIEIGPFDIYDLILKDEGVRFNDFIKNIEKNGFSADLEINCMLDGFKTLKFSGIKNKDEIIILVYSSFESFCSGIKTIQKFLKDFEKQKSFLQNIENSVKKENQVSKNLLDEIKDLNNQLLDSKRDLIKTKIKLETINEQKNIILGTVAHDLRNPLNCIINFSKFLLENFNGPNEQKEMINEIHTASSFMASLVNGLLDFSSIESGKVDLKLEKKDLFEIVSHSIKILKNIADKKEIKISINRTEENFYSSVDLYKMISVIENLLSNAIKYTPKGGQIFISLYSKDFYNFIEIKDTGIGMDKDDLEKIFDKYQTAKSKPTDGEKSTGLGLYIVKKIITSHNGDIQIESQKNKGTLVRIGLKKLVDDEPKIKYKIPDENIKILIADDIETNCKILKKLLEKYNFIVDFSLNGADTIQKIKENKYSILFLDIELNDISGLEIAKKYKCESNLYIIGISGSTNIKSEYFDDYLEKPFDEIKLEEVIQKFLKHIQSVNSKIFIG